MAPFEPDDELTHDVAWGLLRNSPVSLFWRQGVLEETVTWLTEHGYQVVTVDASGWSLESDLHRDIAKALSLPDHYGQNLDALNDCLTDVIEHDYGWRRDSTGLALAFTGYDAFAAAAPYAARAVLDIVAQQSRRAALFGGRLICLVQSNDPQIRFDGIGASGAQWNPAEWLSTQRRSE